MTAAFRESRLVMGSGSASLSEGIGHKGRLGVLAPEKPLNLAAEIVKKAGQKTRSLDIEAMASKLRSPIPRIALTRAEAAAALGMSLDSFERHAQPELRLVRRGRMRLVPVGELERWLERNAERALADELREAL